MNDSANTYWLEQIPGYVGDFLLTAIAVFGALAVLAFLVWSFKNLLSKFFPKEPIRNQVLIDLETLKKLLKLLLINNPSNHRSTSSGYDINILLELLEDNKISEAVLDQLQPSQMDSAKAEKRISSAEKHYES